MVTFSWMDKCVEIQIDICVVAVECRETTTNDGIAAAQLSDTATTATGILSVCTVQSATASYGTG